MSSAAIGRSHRCGELRASHTGEKVRLCGWVNARRDHGGVYFVDLRDRWGIIQLVADEEATEAAREALGGLSQEDCLMVTGVVRMRDERNLNPDRPTGEVEVLVDRVELLSHAERVPFEIVDELDVPEELRLKYRYLDIRRPAVLERLQQRSQANHAIRSQLIEDGFLEVETPLLTRSTPEGARDYLVPSRLKPGSWYALPQSPQLFKQLCMVGGVERYFQIARCLRDEDLRADRQPEFTQLDLELSFVDEEDVYGVVEGVMASLYRSLRGEELALPLERMSYEESVRRYATDKPDLRNPLEVIDLCGPAGTLGFGVYDGVLEKGGLVRAVRLPGGAALARKQIDALEQACKDAGAGGMAWCKVGEDGPTGPLSRFLKSDAGAAFLAAAGCETGDLLCTIADRPRKALTALDALRRAAGEAMGLVRGPDRLLWVTEFPLFEEDDDGAWIPAHHPFTAPHPDDLEALLGGQQGGIRSRAYDLVMNGVELGSGSIRIHRTDVQEAIFQALGIPAEVAQERFRFLLEAFRYGPPPHAGFAIGLDRLYALLFGAESIREVIAFPKTSAGGCPLTDAPAAVDAAQLAELGIRSTSDQPAAEKQ